MTEPGLQCSGSHISKFFRAFERKITFLKPIAFWESSEIAKD